jgi:hypothetical protein
MHFLVVAKQTSRVHSTPSLHSSSPAHSQLDRSKAQRPLSQVATIQSASFGPRQSALRAHSVPAAACSTGSNLRTSGSRLGSGFGTSAGRVGVGERRGTAFARGGGFLGCSGSSPRLATTAMTKPATANPTARNHQLFLFLSVTTAPYLARATPRCIRLVASAACRSDVRTCRSRAPNFPRAANPVWVRPDAVGDHAGAKVTPAMCLLYFARAGRCEAGY